MKLTPKQYAQAFWRALELRTANNHDTAIKKFVETIQRNGDWRKRREIARQCELLWRKANNRPLLTIESARPLSGEQLLFIQRKYKDMDYFEKINPALIAGVRLHINDERELDVSFSAIMKKLFSSKI